MKQGFEEEKNSYSADSTDFRKELNEGQMLLRLKSATEESREAILAQAEFLTKEERFSLLWKLLWQFPTEAELASAQSRKLVRTSIVAVSLLTLFAILCETFKPFGMWSSYAMGLSIIASILTGFGAILNATNNPAYQLNSSVSNITRLLESADDLRTLPAILSYLARHNPKLDAASPLFAALASTLKRLLPAISPEEAQTWTDEQKSTLVGFVSHYEQVLDETLALQTMRLLGEIGDRDSLRVIRKMANGGWAFTPVLRARAREILPTLESRIERLEQPGLLLRASSKPDEAERLLRPVLSGEVEPENELLRAVEGKPN